MSRDLKARGSRESSMPFLSNFELAANLLGKMNICVGGPPSRDTEGGGRGLIDPVDGTTREKK